MAILRQLSLTSEPYHHDRSSSYFQRRYWWPQKHYQINAKMMFDTVMVGIILIGGWGMIGNGTWDVGSFIAGVDRSSRRLTVARLKVVITTAFR